MLCTCFGVRVWRVPERGTVAVIQDLFLWSALVSAASSLLRLKFVFPWVQGSAWEPQHLLHRPVSSLLTPRFPSRARCAAKQPGITIKPHGFTTSSYVTAARVL